LLQFLDIKISVHAISYPSFLVLMNCIENKYSPIWIQYIPYKASCKE